MKVYKYIILYLCFCNCIFADKITDKVFFKIEHDENMPYVNEQWLYKVSLYTRANLIDSNYVAPRVDNALMLSFDESTHDTKIIDGVEYSVEEQLYAIFAQKSGDISIKSPVFNTVIIDGYPRALKIKAKDIKVHVKPAIANFPSRYWFITQDVIINRTIKNFSNNKNDNGLYKIGDVINVTIKILAKGTPAQLIPALSFHDTKFYKLYADKPILQNKIVDSTLNGIVTYKLTLILNKAGDVHLPKVNITWFDSKENKIKVSRIDTNNIIKVIAS